MSQRDGATCCSRESPLADRVALSENPRHLRRLPVNCPFRPVIPGKLHRADYERKARGVPQWNKRYSFCCDQEDCRRRRTPESVRFLGRKVYAGLIVVLISAMMHGVKPDRVRRIREVLNISRSTLKRWRQWWLDNFVRSSFWKAMRARFMPVLCEETLPWSLWMRFELEERDRLLAVEIVEDY